MDSTSFDSWIRDRAAKTNRRKLLGVSFAAGVAAVLGHEQISEAQFDNASQAGTSGTCSYAIAMSSTVTPGTSSKGTLTIEIGADGAIESGTLQMQGAGNGAVVGQASGHALDVLISLGDGTSFTLTGVAPGRIDQCAGPVQGMLANPFNGQLGVWIGKSDNTVVVTGGGSSSGGIQAPVQQPTFTPTLESQQPDPPTPTPTPTEAMALDTDSDGLSDAEEATLGTDPNKPDTDGDGLTDGREVNSHGSNPLDTDTDGDGLTDGLEIDHSSDPNVPDTDGDGLGDAFEANSGFSEPSLADTDGDGDDDLAEFSLGTDPRDPNCFSGPGSVCQ